MEEPKNVKFDIFTTRLGYYTNDDEALHKRMLEETMSYQNKEGRVISNIGGFQSQDLPIEGVFKDFADTVLFSKFYEYLKDDFVFRPAQIRLDNMWANINYQYSSNITHEHPHTDFAFVYYLKVPEDSGDLIFDNPSPTINYSVFFGRAWKNTASPANSLIFKLPPKAGTLVFFPAYLRHHVEQNQNPEVRVSIAGNLTVDIVDD